MNVHRWGDPARPVVVLLHGFAADGLVWAPLAERLAATHHVLAPDLPGHGGSPAPGPGWDLPRAARALERHLPQPDVLVGYSLGGRLALHWALQHPPRQLVLVGASAGLVGAAERAERRVADAAWGDRLAHDLADFYVAWDAQPIFAGRPPVVRRPQDRTALAAALAAFSTGAQAPLHDRLATLACPTTWVVGEHDRKFRAIAEDLAPRQPRATIVVAPGAGHDVPAMAPDTLYQAISQAIGAPR